MQITRKFIQNLHSCLRFIKRLLLTPPERSRITRKDFVFPNIPLYKMENNLSFVPIVSKI